MNKIALITAIITCSGFMFGCDSSRNSDVSLTGEWRHHGTSQEGCLKNDPDTLSDWPKSIIFNLEENLLYTVYYADNIKSSIKSKYFVTSRKIKYERSIRNGQPDGSVITIFSANENSYINNLIKNNTKIKKIRGKEFTCISIPHRRGEEHYYRKVSNDTEPPDNSVSKIP